MSNTIQTAIDSLTQERNVSIELWKKATDTLKDTSVPTHYRINVRKEVHRLGKRMNQLEEAITVLYDMEPREVEKKTYAEKLMVPAVDVQIGDFLTAPLPDNLSEADRIVDYVATHSDLTGIHYGKKRVMYLQTHDTVKVIREVEL